MFLTLFKHQHLMKILFRAMKKRDMKYCIKIVLNSEPWKTLRITKNEILMSLSEGMKNGKTIVATIDKKVVGFVVFYPKGAFPLGGYIKLVAVDNDFRRKGIGKELIKKAEEVIFKYWPNVFLLVSSFNKPAQKFYHSLGYRKVGEIPDFIIAGCSEIIMRKTIGPIKSSTA